MKRILMITVLAIAAVSLALGYSMRETPPVQSNREDEAAIKRVVMNVIEAFNKHDAKAVSLSFTQDADFVNVQGARVKGAAEIEKFLKVRFETVLKEATIKLLDIRVRFIKPDVAIAQGMNETSGMLTSNGQKATVHREVTTRVFIKQNGKWLVTSFQNTSVINPSQPPAREKGK